MSSDGASRSGLLPLGEGVVFGNAAGELMLVDEKGKTRWTVLLQRELAARPVLVGELVVAASLGGEWVGVRKDTGEVAWRLGDGPRVLTPLATDGTRVFAVSDEGVVSALQPTSGNPFWVRRAPKSFEVDPVPRALPAPVVSGGRLFVQLGKAGVQALDVETGEVLWRSPQVDVVGLAADAERLFVSRADGAVLALSAEKGKELWEARLGREATGPPTLLGGRLYVGGGAEELIVLTPEEGRELARVALPGPLRGRVRAAAGWLLVPTAGPEGYFVALHAETLEEGVKLRLDSPLRTAPELVGDRVLLAARDGRLFGFRLRPPSD